MAKEASEGAFWGPLKKVVKKFVEVVDKMLKEGRKEETGVGVVENIKGIKGLNAVYKYNIKIGLDNLPETIYLTRKKALRK